LASSFDEYVLYLLYHKAGPRGNRGNYGVWENFFRGACFCAKNKGGPGSGGREEGEEIALTHRIFVMAKSIPETIIILRLSGAGSQGKSGKIFGATGENGVDMGRKEHYEVAVGENARAGSPCQDGRATELRARREDWVGGMGVVRTQAGSPWHSSDPAHRWRG